MISITNFKDIILSKSGGKPLAKIPNFYSMLYEAMLEVKSNVDLPSAIRTQTLTNPLYTDVQNYVIPNDITLNGIINIRPITADTSMYDFTSISARQFRVESKFQTDGLPPRYASRYKDGIQSLLINANTTSPVLINACESLTVSGTWALFGVSTTLALDSLVKAVGTSSISFTCGVGSSNGVQVTSMPAVDVSNETDLLLYVYIPNATALASVTGIRYSIGQNTSNYYSATVTTDFFGNALAVGQNLIKIPRTSFAVGLGSPTFNLTFARVEILGTFATAQSGFHVDNLVGQIGALYEMDYYSDYQFVDISGNRIAKPTADTDQLVLQGDEIKLFKRAFVEIMATDLKQAGATVDLTVYGTSKLSNEYEMFKFKYPSQRQLVTTQYSKRPSFDR